MPEITIKDMTNTEAGKLSLPEALYAIADKGPLMHNSVVNYLANQRQGTHATKTKGLVSGGGVKPFKQKGTGRARAGSSRSPLWRHGGTVFGPQPRDYYYSMPRRARRKAFFAALSAKLADGQIVAIDSLKFTEPKTRAMAEVLKGLGLVADKGKVCVVVHENDRNVSLAVRNLDRVNLRLAADLNIFDVLTSEALLITREAFAALEKRAEI